MLNPETITDPYQRECAERMIASGTIDPSCATCEANYGPSFHNDGAVIDVFAPRHRASDFCRSGSRNHCTCDSCF